MSKLKLGTIKDDKVVKLTIEFPATVHRNLVDYADAIGRENGQPAPEPVKVVPVMVDRFMAADRAFARIRKNKARP